MKEITKTQFINIMTSPRTRNFIYYNLVPVKKKDIKKFVKSI